MSVIADLIRAGVDPDLVARVAEAIADAARSSVPERSARQCNNLITYTSEYKPHPDVSKNEWRKVRLSVFERDKFTCVYCGSKTTHPQCDHVIPISKGGKSIFENLATSCKSCNSSKKGNSLDEWKRP